MHAALARAKAFASRFGCASPVLMAPMAGASPVALAAAVHAGGGLGALGALLLQPQALLQWVQDFHGAISQPSEAGHPLPLQINLWVPEPAPQRDAAHEAAVRAFLGQWGPPVEETAGDAQPPDFAAQFDAVLQARPAVFSTIMGLLQPLQVQALRDRGIAWFATVTSVAEARAAAAAGADVLVAQGAEAGGHRGCFDAAQGRDAAVGLFSLLPQVCDATPLPVVASGGIADARGVAAALLLGASAVQVGTALLAAPESGVASAWAAALPGTPAEGTRLTRAFSGRWGRALATPYVRAAAAPEAPQAAPYPVQRGLTANMRKAAEQAGDLSRMQAWAGQSAALCRPGEPAALWLQRTWAQTLALLV